jgi:DNA-binding CsgD family transcriptional regulator
MLVHVVEIEGLEFLVFELDLNRRLATLPLTDAERAVMALLTLGHSSVSVAQARSVSVATIASQISAIYRKLGVHSRSEMTLLLLSRSESV